LSKQSKYIMAKINKTKKIKTASNWRSPLRLANFSFAFAITGVLFLLFSSAATVAGFYGSAEQDQVNRINSARSASKIAGLQHIECLNALAEGWAKKMADAGQISHNPNIVNEVDYACGKSWTLLGENVGTGPNSPDLFTAFMNSPAHRANIMDSRFTKVGVGAYYKTDGSLWVVQMFAQCTSCGGAWKTNATLPTDPQAPATTFTCSKVSNLTPAVNLTNLTQPAKPADSAVVQTVTTSTEIRDYYYSSAGSRYTVAFSNHTITSISPNAPVVSGSHAHPNGNSTATGQHQVKIDYTPLFKNNPAGTYTPKVSYKYGWNFNQSLWVKRYAKTSTGTRGSLLYAPAESNGDGAGGTVTDQLTKVVPGYTAGYVNGPTLGPCN
jgi:uncharacterized protein YkwD